MADKDQAVYIIKRIKKGGHGHHGGSWKVAYADFVTAMMAFFLLMWLMAVTDGTQKGAISDYFQNPSAIAGPGGASNSMIDLGTVKMISKGMEDLEVSSSIDPDFSPKSVLDEEEIQQLAEQIEMRKMEELKEQLTYVVSASPILQDFEENIRVDITEDGLRIQIVDQENRPMFERGSDRLKPYAKKLLQAIAKIMGHIPNKISLAGHTDMAPFGRDRYSNWELSADRANASRRELEFGGLPEERISRVVGLASTVLFDKENPYAPVNRRISLIVLNEKSEDAVRRLGKIDMIMPHDLERALGVDMVNREETVPPEALPIVKGVKPPPIPKTIFEELRDAGFLR